MKTAKTIEPLALGGTLFVPASNKNLISIGSGTKFSTLKSMVIDFEDGLDQTAVEDGLAQLQTLLKTTPKTPLLRFIRPRHPNMLETLLQLPDINKIDGFILPKFGLDNAQDYLNLLKNASQHFMPSIEGKELFNSTLLQELKTVLLPHKHKIILIRFGAEDMLRQLRMRRECKTSLFDISATSLVIANLIATFKPEGFEIAAPVFRCFKDENGFKSDVMRDLQEGLLSKTIIHPNQIDLLNSAYQVTRTELKEATLLLENETSIFNLNDTMAEPITMQPWAKSIIKRADLYGTV